MHVMVSSFEILLGVQVVRPGALGKVTPRDFAFREFLIDEALPLIIQILLLLSSEHLLRPVPGQA